MEKEWIAEGEKMIFMTEMYPLIEVATGRIVDWKVGKSFRVNTPKKPEESKQPQKKLEAMQEQEEIL